MRQVHQPVNVLTDAKGHPLKLNSPRKPVGVRLILDSWRYNSRWWQGEAPRDYYLLELESGHIIEVYRSADVWVLSRIAD